MGHHRGDGSAQATERQSSETEERRQPGNHYLLVTISLQSAESPPQRSQKLSSESERTVP